MSQPKHHPGHTATFRGRRVVVILKSGERIEGRFVERKPNMTIVVRCTDGVRKVRGGDIHQFLAGNGTRESSR